MKDTWTQIFSNKNFINTLSARQRANITKRKAFRAIQANIVPEGRPNNVKNDCTIRALGLVCGIEYGLAEYLGELAGRALDRGLVSQSLIDVAKQEGFRFTRVIGGGTLETFLINYPEGRFYIRISGHAFAVIDGKVCDNQRLSPFVRIRGAWRFDGVVTNANTAGN